MSEPDHIRRAIIDRAEQLGLTAYAIAKQAEQDPTNLKRYFNGTVSLSSKNISSVCDVLALSLKPTK